MIPTGARRTCIAAGLLAISVMALGVADSTRAAAVAEKTTVTRQAILMGTRVTLSTLASDRGAGLRKLERLLRTLENVEAELSTWRTESALSAINRQPVGVPGKAPEPICSLLAEAKRWHGQTGGAFDPAVGALIDVWGLREGGRIPDGGELARARLDSGFAHLRIERHPCRITRSRDIRLDAGAFGKGAALDRLGGSSAVGGGVGVASPWMIDLGGQVGVGGRSAEPWAVALAHPARRGQVALELSLTSGSLATSGGSERDVRVGNRRIGHVLDPRTGEPVSRRGSVTVWHPRALVADILSTALYVMGPEEGLAWAREHDIAVCYLIPEQNGSDVEIRATEAFRHLL